MPDITNLDQTANPEDRLDAAYINAVNAKFKELEKKQSLTDQTISNLRDEINNKQEQIDRILELINSINVDGLATIEYADSRAWQLMGYASKRQPYLIPAIDQYFRIPFEQTNVPEFDVNGVYTIKEEGLYIAMAQIRITTTATNTGADLSPKVSAFFNNGETPLPLFQAESARGDLVFTGQNVVPIRLEVDQEIDFRAYLTIGTNASVRERSTVSIWKLPEFNSLS